MQRPLRLRIRLPLQRNLHKRIHPPSALASCDHFLVHSHVASKLHLRPLRMYMNTFMDEMRTYDSARFEYYQHDLSLALFGLIHLAMKAKPAIPSFMK